MLNADLLIGISSLLLAGVAWFVTRDLSHLGIVFIDYTVIALGILGLIVLIKGFVKPERLRFFEAAVERTNVLTGLGMLVVYLIFLPKAGFLLSSYAMYAAFNWYLGDDRLSTKHIVISLVLSFIVVTGFYFVFRHVLEVPLPKGAWFD